MENAEPAPYSNLPLDEFAHGRRTELKLTQEQVAARSGGKMSTATYRLIEGGRAGELRETTKAGLQVALDWPPYAVDLIVRQLLDGRWEDMYLIDEIGSIFAALKVGGVASEEDAASIAENVARMESAFPFDEWGIRPLSTSPEFKALLIPAAQSDPPAPEPPELDLRPVLEEIRSLRRLFEDDRRDREQVLARLEALEAQDGSA